MKKDNRVDLLGEPMIIGALMGLILGIAVGYEIKNLLGLSVNIAAVMYLRPKSGGLIGEGMKPVTEQLRKVVEKTFPKPK